jgi:23S rRNA pseudouridine955/2504/2580 synthase
VVSLVGFSPRTGRTHQLRAHAAHIGTPILGDGKYGGAEAHIGGFDKKLHLHAWGLKLPEGQELFAPLPAHFEQSISFAGLALSDTEIFPCFGFHGNILAKNRKG